MENRLSSYRPTHVLFFIPLGFVPAPLVFGSLIDASCSKWQTSCGERGACVIYDNTYLRQRYHGASAAFKVTTLIYCIIISLNIFSEDGTIIFYKQNKNQRYIM